MNETTEAPELEPERLTAVLDGRDDPGTTEEERHGKGSDHRPDVEEYLETERDH